MDFYGTARKAAAEEYGRRNMEHYAKRAKWRAVSLFFAAVPALVFLIYCYRIGHGA